MGDLCYHDGQNTVVNIVEDAVVADTDTVRACKFTAELLASVRPGIGGQSGDGMKNAQPCLARKLLETFVYSVRNYNNVAQAAF